MNAQHSFHGPGQGRLVPVSGRRPGFRVTHHGRASFSRPSPVLAVWRTRDDIADLRGKKLLRQVLTAFRKCHEKSGFRVTHFSVRGSEVRMMVEADDAASLSHGMQGLGVSMAKRINFTSRRRGAAFDDRFRARALTTSREVAQAIDRVLGHEQGRAGARDNRYRSVLLSLRSGPPLVSRPRTWLLRVGRFRASLLRPAHWVRSKLRL